MNEESRTEVRPLLLKIGILLTVLRASLTLFFAGLLMLGVLIGVPIGMASSGGEEGAVFAVVGLIGAGALTCLGLYEVLALGICFMAWRGTRTWLWALIAISALAAANFPFGTAIGVLTIVGCIQAFERSAEARTE